MSLLNPILSGYSPPANTPLAPGIAIQVANHASMLLIPAEFLRNGMYCFDQFAKINYRWDGANSGANVDANWTAIDTSTSAGAGTSFLPCKYATTGNITLSGAQTVDGATPTNGDQIAVWFQTAQAENGKYTYNSAGAWSRTSDANTAGAFVPGKTVEITAGATYTNYLGVVTNAVTTLGTDPIVFAKNGPGATIGPATSLGAGTMSASDFAKLSAMPVIAVANAAALTALSVATLAYGSPSFVQTFKRRFRYNPSSTATVASGLVINGNGGVGRWITETGDYEEWNGTASWFIDGTGGDNEGTGATGSKIKDFAELKLRIGNTPHFKTSTTITLSGTITDQYLRFSLASGVTLTFAGNFAFVASGEGEWLIRSGDTSAQQLA